MPLTDAQFISLISGAAFISIFLLCFGMLQYFGHLSRRREIVSKIKLGGESRGLGYEESIPLIGAQATGMAGFLGKLGQSVAPTEAVDYSRIRLKFLRAGIRSESFIAVFYGAKILLGTAFFLGFLILRFAILLSLSPRWSIFLGVGAALVGFYLMDILVYMRTRRRRERIRRALPDTLDLLVLCVQAGMGLDSAIHRVAQEIGPAWPDLSDEFSLLNLELRAGKARQDALWNIALRTNLEHMNSLMTLLIQADRFGTSIASSLKVFADGFRNDRFQKAEERAAKLPVKLVFPLIFCIFPSIFVVILGPAAIAIYRNFIHGSF